MKKKPTQKQTDSHQPDLNQAGLHKSGQKKTEQRSVINFTSPLEMAAQPENSDAPRRFSILGYTGKLINAWWGDFVIDINGIQTKPKVPILRDHDHARIAGWADTITKDENGLVLSGTFSQATADGRDALALADEGFPWQASVGIRPLQIKILKNANETATVNGMELRGPMEILSKSLVGETSLVAWGADNDTGVQLLADQGDSVSVEIMGDGPEGEGTHMNIAELQEKHPELYQEVMALGAASVETASIQNEGIQSERARIIEILSEEADPSATRQAITEGLSVDGAFKLFYQAEKAKKAAAIGEMAASANNALGHVTPKDPEPAVADPAREVSNRAVVMAQKDKISLAEATALVLATDKQLAAQYWGLYNE